MTLGLDDLYEGRAWLERAQRRFRRAQALHHQRPTRRIFETLMRARVDYEDAHQYVNMLEKIFRDREDE